MELLLVAVNEEDENLELRYLMECSKKMNQRSWEESDLYSKVTQKLIKKKKPNEWEIKEVRIIDTIKDHMESLWTKKFHCNKKTRVRKRQTKAPTETESPSWSTSVKILFHPYLIYRELTVKIEETLCSVDGNISNTCKEWHTYNNQAKIIADISEESLDIIKATFFPKKEKFTILEWEFYWVREASIE